MVENKTTLSAIVTRFRQGVEQLGVHCEQVYLFGSYAKETPREGSDIDLIVVSSDWSRMGRRERLELLGVAAARMLEPIQAQGFTPDEAKDHRLGAFWESILAKEAVLV